MFWRSTHKLEPSPKVLVQLTLAVLGKVIEKCVPGARIYEICKFGDALILEETGKTFTGKKIDKGLAFPVSISLNNICGHFSPLSDDETVLAKGDVAKM